MDLTATEIEDRMEEAALTLRRLPNPAGSGPKGYGSSWPDYVRDARQAYGYGEATMRVIPSSQEIARMEVAIDWLRLIPDADVRRIVWMKAEGHRWRSICIRSGCARSTANRKWAAGLLTIAKALKNNGKAGVRKARLKTAAGEAAVETGADGAGTLL